MLKDWQKRGILCFIFLFLVIFLRVYVETALMAKRPFFGYYVFFHHFCWFLFVFFWFAFCARAILKIPIEKIPLLALFSPVVFAPVVEALIKGENLRLQYLSGSFRGILFDMVTFFRFSQNDSYFFGEMLFLCAIFVNLSYIVSGSVWRTVLNLICGFFGAMILAGVHYFGVAQNTKAVWHIASCFKNHIFLYFVYFSALIVAFSLLFLPELAGFIKKKTKYCLLLSAAALLLEALFVILRIRFSGSCSFHPADLLVTLLPMLALVFSAAVLAKRENSGPLLGRFFPIFFGIISICEIVGAFTSK